MNKDVFISSIENIYAIFGRKKPEPRHIEIAFRQVKDLPDNFMNYAVRRFEDEENLPKNIGRYLLRDLWPEYLENHPEIKSNIQFLCCPKCIPDIPGYRKAWEPITFHGESTYIAHILRCPCGNAPNPRHDPVLSDDQLLSMGWLLENPFLDMQIDIPEKWRKYIGLKEEIRPEHEAYLKEIEDSDVPDIDENGAEWVF